MTNNIDDNKELMQLLDKEKSHYEQLAPHVKQRETAILLKQLIDIGERFANNQFDKPYRFINGD